MFNKTEQQEREYLETIISKLKKAIGRINEALANKSGDLEEGKKYLYENKADMDHAEKVSVRQSIYQDALVGENIAEKKLRLQKLQHSPYFGRIDFKEEGNNEALPVYIGVHTFYDEKEKVNYIHDWRAPISSMYYDFELGEAWYESPNGPKTGNIEIKRQYRITRGEMEFMLENAVSIHDDILQQELGRAADDKMKNIVATIQRDQNAIIRNESSRVLIIQGVAGSGKTSIALHRLAFLLYRFRQNLSAKDILIISPNKVFADYIANVLPELGEDKIPEKGMEELADELLDRKFRFETFFGQVTRLLEQKDEAFRERISFKSSIGFLEKLNQYLIHIENEYFVPEDIWVNRYLIPEWFIREKYDGLQRVPLFKRFDEISRAVEDNVRFYYKYDITGPERNKLKKAVKNMFRITNLRGLYKDFYQWLGKPEYFKQSRSGIEYSDVYPLIYMKISVEGYKGFQHVKHLLVDEMQDHTPVQYAVLKKLFACKKTILGDANQSVNPYSASSAEAIKKVFPEGDTMTLAKSYRSTWEITQFAQQISPNEEVIPVERHGSEPEIYAAQNAEEEITKIKEIIDEFRNSGNESMGIVCKTPGQAEELKKLLDQQKIKSQLLTDESRFFASGVIITSVQMAKGLEFDMVIVPWVSRSNYQTSLDRSLLYVACTRAMHNLYLTYQNPGSEMIPVA